MRQVSPRSSSLWSLSAAIPLCAALALGCEGNIIGNNNGSGGSGSPGSGGSGSGSGGSGSSTCNSSSSELAAASQRVVLLTKDEVVKTVRYLIDDKAAQALLDTGDQYELTAETGKHFPPKISDGEQQGFNDSNVKPLNLLAENVSTYVSTNFSKLANCATPSDSCATTYLMALATRAYRRQLTSDEQQRFMTLYNTLRSQMVRGYAVTNSVEKAAGYAVWALFMSPQLIWRWEIGGKQMASVPGGTYLTDDELASQVSFFLTDLPPDDMLLQSAKAGMLRTNLASHVSRILQTDAAKKWLGEVMQLYFLINMVPLAPADATKFPIDDGLKSSMYTGAEMFLNDVLWNGNIKDLLLSKTAYVNTRLAETVYKIPTPSGAAVDKFVKVSLPSDQRSGILTDAGFLSALTRTNGQSLIPRAKIVKAATLCIVPPAPPESIGDQVKAAAGKFEEQTGQEQAAFRAGNDACKGCHGTFDAFGLALEFYDAIGRYRTTYDYLNNKVIDGTTTLPPEAGSKTIHNAVEMAQALTESSAFTNCIAKSMLQYALIDMSPFLALPSADGKAGCAVADVVDRYQSGPATFSGLVTAVTQSPAFVVRKLDM